MFELNCTLDDHGNLQGGFLMVVENLVRAEQLGFDGSQLFRLRYYVNFQLGNSFSAQKDSLFLQKTDYNFTGREAELEQTLVSQVQ